MVDSLLECALEMGVRFGTTPESHTLAKVVASFAADATLPTRKADFESNPVADAKAGNLRPDGDNCARRLVAE